MQADERVEGLEIRQTLEDACHPRLVALLVYDMQVGILRQIEDGGAVTPRVREVLHAARASGVRTPPARHRSRRASPLASLSASARARRAGHLVRASDARPGIGRARPARRRAPAGRTPAGGPGGLSPRSAQHRIACPKSPQPEIAVQPRPLATARPPGGRTFAWALNRAKSPSLSPGWKRVTQERGRFRTVNWTPNPENGFPPRAKSGRGAGTKPGD
jgi:hypothetical protein